jgi:hypothetical protein
MIGRIIRLVLVALVLLAAYRTGQVSLDHYRFSDEVDRVAQRAVRTTEAEVREAVAQAATRFHIPVKADDVAIRIQAEHVYVDLAYIRTIEILPRYHYPWRFEVHAHGWVVPSGGVPRR